MAKFDAEIQRWTLASEGGYVDHPRDPGGATNMGITHRTLAAWRGVKSVTKQMVKELTRNEAMAIYKANYWDRVWGDRLPYGLAYAVFDYAVNSGPARAVKDLQRTLVAMGAKPGRIDGIMGVQTADAVNTVDVEALIIAYCERRYAFVKSLSTFSTFGKGWTRRIMGETVGFQANDIGVIDRAVARYRNEADIPAPLPSTKPEDHGKAIPEPESITDTLKKPESWTMIGSGFAAIVSAIADQPILQVGIVLMLAAGLWFFIQRRREADPA